MCVCVLHGPGAERDSCIPLVYLTGLGQNRTDKFSVYDSEIHPGLYTVRLHTVSHTVVLRNFTGDIRGVKISDQNRKPGEFHQLLLLMNSLFSHNNVTNKSAYISSIDHFTKSTVLSINFSKVISQ